AGGRAVRRPVEQLAARHVDDGRHVLRLDVRGLPEPAAAWPAARPQHGGVRRADPGDGPGAAAETRAAAAVAAPADAPARRLDRAPPPPAPRRQRADP